jgi:DNA mismatch endonuclease (patch repair protein)
LKGRKLSEETKRKMQLFHNGKHNSEKHNKNISEIRKKLFEEGKLIFSEETRQKMRLNRLKQIFPIKDTGIEIVLQKELNNQNIKFLTHYPIFGQPDIFIEPNICIFVDGCYWHGCEKCFNRLNEYQIKRKIKDEVVNSALKSYGYVVLRIWEHDIKNNSKQCINKIIEQIEVNKIEINKTEMII